MASPVYVSTRDNKVYGEFRLDNVLDKFRTLDQKKVLKSEEYG